MSDAAKSPMDILRATVPEGAKTYLEHKASIMGHVPSSELLCCQASFVEVGDHLPVDDVGELALKAAHRFPPALAIGPLALQVVLRAGVATALHEGHRVQRQVELAIAAAIETMTLHLPRAGRDRRHAGGHGEGRRATESARVAALGQKSRRGQRTDAADRGQARAAASHQRCDLPVESVDLRDDRQDPRQAPLGEAGPAAASSS
jgi:hypothetical protein